LNFSFGQNNVIFKTSYFDDEQSIQKTKVDTIKHSGIIDIDFYRKHFFMPYNYPRPFINEQYKDTTIVKWSNENIEKDYFSNWTFTYVYDSLSRVIYYEYSGCLVCSQSPYFISIYYDTQNRPVRIYNNFPITKVISDLGKSRIEINKEDSVENFEFVYNSYGEITQMKYYKYGILNMSIEKI
jgi:hypothetical protein